MTVPEKTMSERRASRVAGRIPALCITFVLAMAAAIDRSGAEEIHFAIQAEGRLMGCLEITVTPGSGEEPLTLVESRLFARISLEDENARILIEDRYRIDPASGRVRLFDSTVTQGANRVEFNAVIEGGAARFGRKDGGEPTVAAIGPDVIVGGPLEFGHFLRDLKSDGAEKSYRLYDFSDGRVHDVSITRLGKETLALQGEERETVIFDWTDREAGIHRRLWLDPASGRFLVAHLPNGSVLVSVDPSVTGLVRRAERDPSLFAATAVRASRIESLVSMKVKATLTTTGNAVTAESLNTPGQKFTGSIDGETIDGLFEITTVNYDGAGAPSFPPDLSAGMSLPEYQSPSDGIESNDPGLVKKAITIFGDASDSWDAALRAARWVAANTVHSLRSGSALETLASGRGDSGARSRLLAALCRSGGIPARPVAGCVYTPLFGGSFAPRVWTEVHLGERLGWIALDVTLREFGRLHAGHIRLGSHVDCRPGAMEILDYRIATDDGKVTPGGERVLGRLPRVPWEVGKTYTYRCTYDGKFIGFDSFTVESCDRFGEEGVYHFSTRLDHFSRKTEGEWKITDRGRPLFYRLKGKTADGEYSVECDFLEDRVHYRLDNAGEKQNVAAHWKEAAFIADNTNVSLFAFLFSSMPIEVGKEQEFKIFHITSRSAFPAKATITKRIPGAWVCEFKLYGMFGAEIHLDDLGRIVRQTDLKGRMVMELVENVTGS